jgi:hypothetical protein
LLLPFGFEHERWNAFKAAMNPGDELWEYCSAKETWDQGLGMAGIELVRDGKVIAHLMTRMN